MSRAAVHEVVISGMSGLFPECEDVDQLWERLLNKADLVTIDSRRWTPGEFDVPAGTGKVMHPEKFDMTFFGIHRRLCEKMDPYTRLLCEQAYRAVCDAGVNPRYLDGSNTAVVMGSFSSEPEHDMGASFVNQGTYNVLAFSRTMQANRLSYFLNTKGPSFQIDCSGCAGIQAIQYARDMIASGECTAAIVGTCHLINKPEPSYHYQVMGRLSEDSMTRCYSSDATGYARSESCITLFLQRKEHAKRIYGSILAAEVICHGSKEQAFSEFPLQHYDRFLVDTYRKANVDPRELAYVETYGAASRTLDAQELNATSRALLQERTDPLLIGSIKSNMGHTEGSSSFASLTKVLMALDRGTIAPSINYNEPNPDIPDLVSGKIQVVTEPTPLQGDIVGLSELSLTGICGHMILKRCEKVKPSEEQGAAKKDDSEAARLPLLVIMSGRNDQVLTENLKNMQSKRVDEEFVLLLNSLYRGGIKSHVYRGYSVIDGTSNSYNAVGPAPSGEKRPIWFMYSGMGSQWPTMAKTLMALPIFAQAIHKCHAVLAPKGVNLLDIVMKDDESMFDVILNSFVGIAAVQIGLTDVLRAVGVHPDGIIGHSVGELGCAYADGCLTAEQMILAAHARGRASIEAVLIKGMMAAVGVGYNTIKNSLPESIEVACHNSKDSCTLSGPAEDMAAFIATIKAEGTFAKLVNVANIAYHSRYIKPAAPALLKYLKEIIPVAKKRSSKWVSSSILEPNWDSELAQYSSAEYHTNNLLSSVLFEEASAHVPSNAIVIEIAPHGLLQAIVKRSMSQATHIPLTSRFDRNNLMFLFGAIGKMFMAGIPVDLQAIYPAAQFPVSRGTPTIAPLIDWLRDENFIIRRLLADNDYPSPLCRYVSIKRDARDFAKLPTQRIHRRMVFPSSFYFNNIMEVFKTTGNIDGLPIVMEKFKFNDYAEILEHSSKELRFHLLKGTGNVVVSKCENEEIVVEGNIKVAEAGFWKNLDAPSVTSPNKLECISRYEMTRFMKMMGLDWGLANVALDGIFVGEEQAIATAQWNGSIASFLTTLFALAEFYETKKSNLLKMLYKVGNMKIDLPVLSKYPAPTSLTVEYDARIRSIRCEGILMSLVDCKYPGTEPATDEGFILCFDYPRFVPYNNTKSLPLNEYVSICTQLVLENAASAVDSLVIKIVEIGQKPEFHTALKDLTESMRYTGKTQMTSFTTEKEFLEHSSILLQKNVWLVFANPPSDETLKSLSVIKNGFVLMPKKKLLKNSFAKVVFESPVNDVWYSLISIHGKQCKRQYEVVNLKDSYMSLLKYQLSLAGDLKFNDAGHLKTIILWGQVDALITVDNILEETKNLPNSHLLHYWFFIGDSPDLNTDDTEFKNQIHRDVKVNISVGGVWGSLRLQPANMKNTVPHSGTAKFYFPLSTVTSTHNLSAIGLNIQDSSTDEGHNELGFYDYVSSTTMGLGMYDSHSKSFNPDSILSWSKPSTWTPEEAATVPMLYSLASYIIHHMNNAEYTNDQTILVTRALLPLSQALIALALYENITVYASVYGEQEKQKLLKLFPKLKDENIYDCSSIAFFIDIYSRTKGIYKVINNFEETRMILPLIKCVKPLGVLIYASQPLMSEKSMGMLKFNDEIVAKGISNDILMKSGNGIKTDVRNNVQEALVKGAVLPITTVSILPPSILNTDAVQKLKSGSSKIVVSGKDISTTNESKICLQDESKCHIIVEGKIQVELCLDILEWLLKRGSKKVIVFMRQSHPFEATSLRLQSLRDQYKRAEIDVRPTNQLSSKGNIEKCVEEFPASGPAMIFFLGSNLKEKIELFDDVLSNRAPACNMICIGKGGENVCERRKRNSLPALYVRCSTATLECINLPQYLDCLIEESSRDHVVMVNKCTVHNHSLQGLMADLTHVPDTEAELQDLLSQCTPHATFVEIPTSSPTRRYSKEVYPMFLIPGLRPRRLHRMASQLFCPAFEARFPPEVANIDQLASDLTQQLVSLAQNMFTLVADDWGGILALHVAAKLEALSKTVTVILLDAAPVNIAKWANGLLQNELALIGKYLKTPADAKSSNESWDEKLSSAFKRSGVTNEDRRTSIESCLNFLKTRLQSVVSIKPPSKRLRNKCHLVEISSRSTKEHGLRNYVRQEPIVHLKEATNFLEILNSEELANDLNSLLMFEYKDAANPPIEEYLHQNIVKKSHWQSSLLYRVRE